MAFCWKCGWRSAGSKPEQDFAALDVELKTIPSGPGRPWK
ncbi:MutH/Sau3AI family endonuclease [Shigella flexneri]